MAISPPSDIVLDVARAADPAGVEAARAALAQRAAKTGAPAEPFAVASRHAPAATGNDGARTPTPESFKRFEAMVLQTFIQNMLPRDGESIYGKGIAGDMWKSQLAEKVADSIAERGGIGIADRVLGDRYRQAEKAKAAEPATGATGAAPAAPPAELSPALIDEMLHRLNESLVQVLSGPGPNGTDRG